MFCCCFLETVFEEILYCVVEMWLHTLQAVIFIWIILKQQQVMLGLNTYMFFCYILKPVYNYKTLLYQNKFSLYFDVIKKQMEFINIYFVTILYHDHFRSCKIIQPINTNTKQYRMIQIVYFSYAELQVRGLCGTKGMPIVRSYTAVSYTHLDVYKRQPFNGKNNSCRIVKHDSSKYRS